MAREAVSRGRAKCARWLPSWSAKGYFTAVRTRIAVFDKRAELPLADGLHAGDRKSRGPSPAICSINLPSESTATRMLQVAPEAVPDGNCGSTVLVASLRTSASVRGLRGP